MSNGCEPPSGRSGNEEGRKAMIEQVGIIGAGTMGNGIAQVCAAAGLDVTMVDISEAAVARGLATVSRSLDRLVKKEKLTAAETEARLSRVTATTAKAK